MWSSLLLVTPIFWDTALAAVAAKHQDLTARAEVEVECEPSSLGVPVPVYEVEDTESVAPVWSLASVFVASTAEASVPSSASVPFPFSTQLPGPSSTEVDSSLLTTTVTYTTLATITSVITLTARPTGSSPQTGNSPSALLVSTEDHSASQTASSSGQTVSQSQNNETTSGSRRNALYFTNWGIYGADFQPQQLPASQVSHVLYSFADIASDGQVISSDSYADLQKHYSTDSWNDQGNNAYGCIKQLYLLKKKNRGMKVLLSIGGWTYSPKFPPVAATDAGRQKFASSAVKLVTDWGFDGIDIDWEYPANPTEAQNFVLLLQACRQALDSYAKEHAPGYHFFITIAAPAGPTHIKAMDLEGMDKWVDAWNLMAYDYAGSWDSTSGHQANLYADESPAAATKFSTDEAVREYLGRGIPGHKINLGLPLYGRSFEATRGLGEPYNGIGPGSIQSGVWLYKDLPRAGSREIYDNVAKASYSYDAATSELISYDTVASAEEKARYLLAKGLGGAVFWEASGDKKGSGSLVGTLAEHMGSLDQTHNLLSYPASQYDNIRDGMPGL